MSSSPVVPDDAKDEFWAVVVDCLHEIHNHELSVSRLKADTLRQSVERADPAKMELFYHSEPFDVACEIAQQWLNVEDHLDQYLHIRDDKHGSGIASQFTHQRRSKTRP